MHHIGIRVILVPDPHRSIW